MVTRMSRQQSETTAFIAKPVASTEIAMQDHNDKEQEELHARQQIRGYFRMIGACGNLG